MVRGENEHIAVGVLVEKDVVVGSNLRHRLVRRRRMGNTTEHTQSAHENMASAVSGRVEIR